MLVRRGDGGSLAWVGLHRLHFSLVWFGDG